MTRNWDGIKSAECSRAELSDENRTLGITLQITFLKFVLDSFILGYPVSLFSGGYRLSTVLRTVGTHHYFIVNKYMYYYLDVIIK